MSAAKFCVGCSKMSRVGKSPVVVPEGVEVKVDGAEVRVKGKRGELSLTAAPEVSVALEDGRVMVRTEEDTKRGRQMWGLMRSLVNNMVVGVTEGFTKRLQIEGVGYRAAVEGKTLKLDLGFSHQVVYAIPQGIEIACERPTAIAVTGADRQQVGQVAAEIRKFRPPEPYKGKGIRYEGEYVRRKEGKKK